MEFMALRKDEDLGRWKSATSKPCSFAAKARKVRGEYECFLTVGGCVEVA